MQRTLEIILPALLISSFIFFILMLQGHLTHSALPSAVGATTLATSSFTLITRPDNPSSHPKHIAFGFIISIATGLFFQHALNINLFNFSPSIIFLSDAGYSAIAVATSVLIMCLTRIYHPPAIGLTMGLVLENWDHEIFYVITVSCAILFFYSFIQMLVKKSEMRAKLKKWFVP